MAAVNFLVVVGATRPPSRYQPGWLLPMPLSWAGRCLPPVWPSSVCLRSSGISCGEGTGHV